MPVLSSMSRAASRAILGFAAMLLIALPMTTVAAAREPIQGAMPSAGTEPPLAPIEQLDQGLIAIMKAGKATPFQSRVDMLAPIVDRVLDLPYILRTSVGLGWSRLTPDQQSALLAAFRQYTIASYVDNFDSYDGQRFAVSPDTRPLGNGDQVVSTQIIPKSGSGHKLDYVMRKTNSGWKAVDVLADGSISRVAVQRSDFGSLLTRGGAPALETSLQRKTQTLSRG